jgi:hypothetical protein
VPSEFNKQVQIEAKNRRGRRHGARQGHPRAASRRAEHEGAGGQRDAEI